MSKIRPVGSLTELRVLANSDPQYAKLLITAASNLGFTSNVIDRCYDYLLTNASESNEEMVVEEVNFCLDLI